MAEKSKSFKLVIQGDTKDLEKQLEAVRRTAAGLGLEVTKSFSSSNLEAGKVKTTISLLSRDLQNAETVANAFGKSLNKYFLDVSSGAVSFERALRNVTAEFDKLEKKGLSSLQRQVKAFQDASKAANTKFKENLSVDGTSAAAKRKTAQEELQIRRDLAAKIAQIEKDLASGTIRSIGAANAKRSAAINQAFKEITNLRTAAEASIRSELQLLAAEAEAYRHNALLTRQKTDAERASFNERKQFYLNWINESYRLEQQEIANNKRKNAQIHSDTLAMYRQMFDEIAAKEKANQARIDAARNSSLIRGMSNAPSLSSIRLSAGMDAAGRAANQQLPPIIPRGATADLENHRAAVDRLSLSHRALLGHVASVLIEYKLLNATYNAITNTLRDIPKAGIEAQITESSLFGIFGTEKGIENIKFIDEIAERAGANLLSLEQSYRRYAPAAALAGATQEDVNKSFRSFAEVGTILHFTEDKVAALFLALEQMYSKGTVHAEEITRQLGNVLPGAVEVGAKAMGMTPRAFMDAMRKNEVAAKEFIPKFAKIYRETFGGENDEVFENTTAKLLSNYNRMVNQFTLAKRKVAREIEGTLNDIVRGGGSSLKVFQENLTGVGQAIELVSGLLVGRLAISLTTVAAQTVRNTALNFALLGSYNAISFAQGRLVAGQLVQASTMTRLGIVTNSAAAAAGTFLTRMTGLSVPVLAATTGTIALTKSLLGLELGYNSATGFLVKFKNEQVSLTNYIRSFALESLSALQDAFKAAGSAAAEVAIFIVDKFIGISEESKAKLRKAAADLGKSFKNTFVSNLLPTRKDFDEFVAIINTFRRMSSGASMRLPDTNKIYQEELDKRSKEKPFGFGEGYEKDIKDVLDSLRGRSISEIQEAISDGRLVRPEDVTKALENASSVDAAVNLFSGQNNTGSDIEALSAKQVASATKARNAAYKDIARDLKVSQEAIKTTLEELDAAYEKNEISIKDYYDRKIEKILESQRLEVEAYDKARQVALRANDAAKAEEFQDKIDQSVERVKGDQTSLFAKRTEDVKNFTKSLQELHVEYLKFQGKTGEAELLQFDLANAEKAKKLLTEAKSGDASAEYAKKQLDILREYAGVSGQITQAKERQDILSDQLANKELQIQAAKNVGATTELQSLYQLQAARENYIKQAEEQIRLQEKLLTLHAVPPEVAQNIENARAQLEAFKKESQLVSSFYQNIVTKNFSDAFAAYVTGAQSAGQAFDSFTQGVIKNIAEIVAQEATSGIIKMLISSFSSISAAYPSEGGLSGAIANAFGSSKGNAFSGGKVIPFRKGGIPDVGDKLAYFPMAKGGIGSLRENGPEAILPLKRTPGGDLGVINAGTSGDSSSVNNYYISVNVEKGKGESSEETGSKVATAAMRAIAREEIISATRRRNILNPVTKV